MISFRDDVTEAKKGLFIIIFGPYKKGGISKLTDLQNYLRSVGYDNAYLVSELDDPPGLDKSIGDDLFFYRKSNYWVEKCQIALFIFFKDISYGSAIVEMTRLFSTSPEKSKCASFFIEEGHTPETLVSGIIRDHDCLIAHFEKDTDLFQLSMAACLNHLIEDKCGEMESELE